jgi:(1->4)-alpha-D-glucan 1-alpha-D-glucosylmutase
VFELVRRGAATGLRVDHVDGLFAPGDYLNRLQSRLSPNRDFYIVVEKILGQGEELSGEWPVHGTTGYEFASVVNNLFVDRRNERALDDIYKRVIRDRRLHDDDARQPNGCRSTRWSISARSRSSTKPCQATSIRSDTS